MADTGRGWSDASPRQDRQAHQSWKREGRSFQREGGPATLGLGFRPPEL
jgi:hypothetical protein